MKRMEEAKKRYDSTPIPEELSERIQTEIQRAEIKRRKKRKRAALWKKAFAAAAAVAAVFVTALNVDTAFAEGAARLPGIGEVARVFTFRSYQKTSDDLSVSIDIPGVDKIAEDTGEMESKVTEEIYFLCQEYAKEAQERAEEYKKAFLETGGTQEEWEAHNIEIKVWYEVKSRTENYLSVAIMGTESWSSAYGETKYYNFDRKWEAHNIEIKVWYEVKSRTENYLSVAIMGTESWSSAYGETKYYNFDRKTGGYARLSDFLGEDYAETAEKEILRQIGEREKETGIDFWEEDLPAITDKMAFYVNAAENPVILFEKYEIAPGAAGAQSFEIVAD